MQSVPLIELDGPDGHLLGAVILQDTHENGHRARGLVAVDCTVKDGHALVPSSLTLVDLVVVREHF